MRFVKFQVHSSLSDTLSKTRDEYSADHVWGLVLRDVRDVVLRRVNYHQLHFPVWEALSADD